MTRSLWLPVQAAPAAVTFGVSVVHRQSPGPGRGLVSRSPVGPHIDVRSVDLREPVERVEDAIPEPLRLVGRRVGAVLGLDVQRLEVIDLVEQHVDRLSPVES